jgi:rare lipoprotein A (peptidoglycan hydrolase)
VNYTSSHQISVAPELGDFSKILKNNPLPFPRLTLFSTGGEGQMEGVKTLVVLASIYYPGDGVVAKNNYQTSSGQRYDQSAPKCAALQWPLGTMLHLVHGRNNIDVTINDHGPYRKGRALDCTPAVDKALHLGGLGSVRVEAYPPLPKARPVEAQVATWSGD